MTKQIDVEEAKSWDEEEAQLNIEYLTARNRVAEVDRINELRGGKTPKAEFDFDSKIDDVLAWVSKDSERAGIALKAEKAKGADARVTLVEALEQIATS